MLSPSKHHIRTFFPRYLHLFFFLFSLSLRSIDIDIAPFFMPHHESPSKLTIFFSLPSGISAIVSVCARVNNAKVVERMENGANSILPLL